MSENRDHETPWKGLLTEDTERAVAFFYSDIHADTDWTHDPESLEQEFRKTVPAAGVGNRLADKLLKLVSKSGDPRYLHFEIQSSIEKLFAHRVHVYNSAAELRYGQPVVSLPLLIDGSRKWRPSRYRAEQYGTSTTKTFRVTKMLDYTDEVASLEADANPVAVFVLAWLEGRRLGEDYEAILPVKANLIRRLREIGLPREDGRRWEGYLDWHLTLPEEYNPRLFALLDHVTQEDPMSFVAYLEQQGKERGHRTGRLEAVRLGLDLRFGEQGLALMPRVERLESLEQLQAVYDAIKPATSLDDIAKLLPT